MLKARRKIRSFNGTLQTISVENIEITQVCTNKMEYLEIMKSFYLNDWSKLLD